ncbi:unnamed protein product [Blepharisma stoltei]|uniref:Protein kinase domain-containing protein n=1 Tax=Blepharisma stoltei TaxID=1481888 RepID=A0AAU9K1D6_9CILI|nr:unnamed protein product [Blepharisma stoltei]
MEENSKRSKGIQSPMKTKTIQGYELLETLGKGTFGKVKLGLHLLTGEKVAIKVLDKNCISDVSDVERISREIHILKLIRHENLVQLYEVIETSEKIYLVMEYVSGGELFTHIVNSKRLKEKEACKFYQQIISGIEYIHKLNIVHRDLKPENLLLDHDKTLKFVDFGLSNTYLEGEMLKTACGSPCYAAPEMIAGKSYIASRVDIWSSGVILFTMLCGHLPFEDSNTHQLYKKILAGEYHVPKYVTPEAKDFLKCILNTNPEERYRIDQIRQHPWFNLIKPSPDSFGFIIGYDDLPINQKILKQLSGYDLDPYEIQNQLISNKQSNEATAYYLLLKKSQKKGEYNDTEEEPYDNGSTASPSFHNKHRKVVDLSQTYSFSPHPPLPKTGYDITISPRHKRIVETISFKISVKKRALISDLKNSQSRHQRVSSLLPSVNPRSPRSISRLSESPQAKHTKTSVNATTRLPGHDRFSIAATRVLNSPKFTEENDETISAVESTFKIRPRVGTAMLVKALTKKM